MYCTIMLYTVMYLLYPVPDDFKLKFRLRLPLNRYRRILGTILMQRMADTTWFYQTTVLLILTSHSEKYNKLTIFETF